MWSAYIPFALAILVQILLKSTVLFCHLAFATSENKKGRYRHVLKNQLTVEIVGSDCDTVGRVVTFNTRNLQFLFIVSQDSRVSKIY